MARLITDAAPSWRRGGGEAASPLSLHATSSLQEHLSRLPQCSSSTYSVAGPQPMTQRSPPSAAAGGERRGGGGAPPGGRARACSRLPATSHVPSPHRCSCSTPSRCSFWHRCEKEQPAWCMGWRRQCLLQTPGVARNQGSPAGCMGGRRQCLLQTPGVAKEPGQCRSHTASKQPSPALQLLTQLGLAVPARVHAPHPAATSAQPGPLEQAPTQRRQHGDRQSLRPTDRSAGRRMCAAGA